MVRWLIGHEADHGSTCDRECRVLKRLRGLARRNCCERQCSGPDQVWAPWLRYMWAYYESGFRSTRKLSPCSVHSSPCHVSQELVPTCPQPGPLDRRGAFASVTMASDRRPFMLFGTRSLAPLSHHSGGPPPPPRSGFGAGRLCLRESI